MSKDNMSGYQITLSIIRLLAVATGLYIIGHKLAAGPAPVAWGLFCLLICSALIMHTIIDRLPMSHEAIFRATNARDWSDLSLVQRHCLRLFDLPLFWAIRDREAQRLGADTLFRIACDGNDITLQPADGKHIERYFSKRITFGISRYGLRAQSAEKGFSLFKRTDISELRLAGNDGRIIQYVFDKFSDDDLVSLQSFGEAVEAGYISTLPEMERDAYVMAMR